MNLKVILFTLAFIASCPIYLHAATADAPVKPVQLPDELMFRGKPIDPSCFFNPFVMKYGTSWEIKDKCPEPEHDGAPLMVGPVVTKPDGSIGYSRLNDRGATVEFFYRYLGAMDQGFLIQTNFTHGGTSHWGFVNLYKREANHIVFVKKVLGGDGADSIRYENGSLYHSYSMTAADLFEKYAENGTYEAARHNGFGGCRVCVAVEALVKDDRIESLRISNKNPHMPECFKKTFLEAFSIKNEMSENEMREVFSKFHSSCPLEK